MPRLHFVKKARKANKDAGIKKGDSYFWWKFRVGRSSIKRFSKTRPRRSQLTMSEFLGTMYDAEDNVSDALAVFQSSEKTEQDFSDLADVLDSTADEVQSAGEECSDKHGNMPDSLQQSPTGELLETRSQRCEEISDSLRDASQAVRDAWDDTEPDVSAASESCSDIDWSTD